jgi:hypothetical protein
MVFLQKEKAAESQRATSKKNDKDFQTAVDCFKAKGGACVMQDNKKSVCEICRNFNPVKRHD